MHLYRGEGLSEYLDQVELAVETWNSALMGTNRTPAIEIVHDNAPSTYNLAPEFGESHSAESSTNVRDGEPVIYDKLSSDDPSTAGFA